MFKEYFLNNNETILTELKNSEYKNTAKALLSFYEKSLSIDNVITSIDYEKDFYPCLILVRSQIEHFIVSSYIWIQFRLNENDKTASIYYGEYLIQEIIKRLNYAKQNNISLTSKYSIAFQKILETLTDKQIIKQKHIQEINFDANQFDIKRINKFYEKNLPLKFDNIIKSDRIKEFLEFYNYFSSFVHGGPSADAFIQEHEKERKKIIENTSYIQEWSSNLVGFQRLFIFYFIIMKNEKFENDFKDEFEKFMKKTVANKR